MRSGSGTRTSQFTLIKIVGVHRGAAVDPLQLLRLDREDAVLVLQHALDEQERLADDGQLLAIEEIRPHDDVRNAGLVLEREEDESFRGAWALARDDHASDAHAPAVARRRQV